MKKHKTYLSDVENDDDNLRSKETLILGISGKVLAVGPKWQYIFIIPLFLSFNFFQLL